MLKKTFWFLLALCGIAFSVFMIDQGRQQPPTPSNYFPPPQPPYEHYIAGEGILESLDQNISIGTPFPELVTHVYVNAGDRVTKCTPLFKLDTRQLEANLKTERAKIEVARVELANASLTFSYFEKLKNKNAVSQKEYTQAYYAKAHAQATLNAAAAAAHQIEVNIKRSTVVAPSDGVIIQQNIHAGETVNLNPFNNIPLMLFGNTTTMQVRANIAEEDAWRIYPGAPATAYVKGNSALSIPLTFSYIEPFVVPKEQLTGADIERVDTRVLQVIYICEKNGHPIYVGQLLDLYIEAKPSRQQ